MFKIGISPSNMVDIKMELGGNGRSHEMHRSVSRNYLGETCQQIGAAYRVYSGSVAFDNTAERDFLLGILRSRLFYFQDDTTGGTGGPIRVYMRSDVGAIFDEPTVQSGAYAIHFEEVEAA